MWSTHNITNQKVLAHTSIIGNEVADRLANDDTTLNLPHHHPLHGNANQHAQWRDLQPTLMHNQRTQKP